MGRASIFLPVWFWFLANAVAAGSGTISPAAVSLAAAGPAAISSAAAGPAAAVSPAKIVATPIAEFRGRTMGTTYSVKVVDPPADLEALRVEIDAELRRVNSEMSTYLESSEITRFNLSDSTDWFEVSANFAKVVSMSLELSVATDGAFDVTIGPYIDLWNFGAAERTGDVPSDSELDRVSAWVGYQKLHARTTTPIAIRKDHPRLAIDLSAIAKGHGVDRVIELLVGKGLTNSFVEIGGEVRVVGDKSGAAWRVGIQMPDATSNEVMIAHPLNSAEPAMATSGDYRNFFDVDGKRYSHTIDPRTRRPVQHSLASVTVLAASCMMADGWATALTVLGRDGGFEMAKQNGVEALLVSRTANGLEQRGTGMLAEYSRAVVEPLTPASFTSTLMPLFAITGLIFGAILAAMAIGVMFGRHAISGSCGGIAGIENADGSVSCSLCSNPADGCKDLRERLKEQDG